MTTEAAFLQAILAAPDDATPRLVYADWLEESADGVPCPTGCKKVGSVYMADGVRCPTCYGTTGLVSDGRAERAEFIRVQCELARPQHAGHDERTCAGCCLNICRVGHLRRRERELLEKVGATWAGHEAGLPPLPECS